MLYYIHHPIKHYSQLRGKTNRHAIPVQYNTKPHSNKPVKAAAIEKHKLPACYQPNHPHVSRFPTCKAQFKPTGMYPSPNGTMHACRAPSVCLPPPPSSRTGSPPLRRLSSRCDGHPRCCLKSSSAARIRSTCCQPCQSISPSQGQIGQRLFRI